MWPFSSLSFWCWLKEKAVIVLRGPQACFELRALSQWRVGGPAKCQAHMATLARLNAGLCLALVLVPPPTLCVFIPLSPASPLCLRCTCHLVWLHICGYPAYKARTAALFVQATRFFFFFALWGTCHGLNHFTHAKEASPLIVSTAKRGMLVSRSLEYRLQPRGVMQQCLGIPEWHLRRMNV